MTPAEAPAGVWHILTPEFPPQVGGVADYTRLVAEGLAAAGDEVHVWCPPGDGAPVPSVVSVHRELGAIRPADLRRVGRQLSEWPGPRHLLVQWVPHGYGYRSMNLGFCAWLWWRSSIRRDRVDIMVHEPYLEFWGNSWRHVFVAFVHRLMTVVLLRAAHRVWMAIPSWESLWRPYALGRRLSFTWLPVASGLPGCRPSATAIDAVRARCTRDGRPLVGHFGAYSSLVADRLLDLLPRILGGSSQPSVLLVGAGSDQLQRRFAKRHPDMATRVSAAGYVPSSDLAMYLSACDVFVQPYPDGISSRRTSAMAVLSLARPLVTTRGHLTEELWDQSGALLLADVSAPEGLAAHVDRLLADSVARQSLGNAGRDLYARLFDVKQTIMTLRGSVAVG
jgi:glycosyltransferase involved in cell wall biosynthesis